MANYILIACTFTFLIHMAESLSYSIRLAGVRLGKLAVALSLTGIIVLVSRTSNMIQAPITGKIIDHSLKDPEYNPIPALHWIIGSASLGTLAAILLLPSAIGLASRVILHLDASGSFPQMVRHSFTLERLGRAPAYLRSPRLDMLSRLRIGGIPKRFILLNIAVTAIYTIGVLSTLLAVTLAPEHATSASQASGLINGIATILLTLLIDPKVGILTDQVLRGDKKQEALTKIFGLLMISRLIGTLLAQLLLVPAAYWIKWMVTFVL